MGPDALRNNTDGKLSRRSFFSRVSDGIYGTALATVLSGDIYGSLTPLMASTLDADLPDGHRRIYDLKPRSPHFPPKAKAVIHLFMNGGPSQVVLFDQKPALQKHDGEKHETSGGQSDVDHSGKLLGSPFTFKQYGKSGLSVSELLPYTASCIDDICVIRSMVADNINHTGAALQLCTGEQAFSQVREAATRAVDAATDAAGETVKGELDKSSQV